jgi:hypothetical protein
MCCVTTYTFEVLINGVASRFFKPSKGLRKEYPLFPYLFLLVEKYPRRYVLEGRRMRSVKGILKGRKALSHMLFMDDVLLFLFKSYREVL